MWRTSPAGGRVPASGGALEEVFEALAGAEEPGFHLERTEAAGRNIRYTTYSYATGKPQGTRYS